MDMGKPTLASINIIWNGNKMGMACGHHDGESQPLKQSHPMLLALKMKMSAKWFGSMWVGFGGGNEGKGRGWTVRGSRVGQKNWMIQKQREVESIEDWERRGEGKSEWFYFCCYIKCGDLEGCGVKNTEEIVVGLVLNAATFFFWWVYNNKTRYIENWNVVWVPT